MNSNFTDVGSEITGSLPRDGQAAMTGQFKASSGTLTAPGMAWSADTDTGFRRSAANTTMAVAGGSDIASISEDGIAMQSGKSLTDADGSVIVGLPTGLGPLPWSATTAPTGWVRCNGLTIGNASSSATERANADTEDLFTHLWNNYANAQLAVSGGRGVSAAADYAANKTIALPDMKGRTFFGLDDMGGSAAGRLGTVITNATTNGATGGTETVTLSVSEMPSHNHGGATGSGGSHSHTYTIANVAGSAAGGGGFSTISTGTASTSTVTDHTHTISSQGGGSAHSNMPPAFLGTWIIKL